MADYCQQWEDYKRRRNQLLFVFIGYVPITFTFGVLTEKLFHTDKPFFVFAGLWLILFVIAVAHYQGFPCPRCGKWFFASWFYRNPFARRCVHCKLPLYSFRAMPSTDTKRNMG
jgi:hypothetical protein